MDRCSFVPYEGYEPYIFISYSHKDSDKVFPIIEELDRRGYRVWYDDGIAPGSEWPENIATHLSECAVVLAFISPNSIESPNCRREITFALSKNKTFLAIILEETKMSLGMEMQLSAQQCVMRYSYASEKRFIDKICSTPELEICKDKVVKVEISNTETHNEVINTDLPKVPKKKKVKTKEKKKSSKNTKRILLGIAIVLVVLIIGLAVRASYMNINVTETLDASRNDTYINFYKTVITDDVIKQIGKLDKLIYITFNECDFSACTVAPTFPVGIEQITLKNCVGIEVLTESINNYPNISRLEIINCGLTDDMLPTLTCPEIRYLDLSGNPEFTNVDIIPDSEKLSELNLSGTGITKLPNITGAGITSIHFSNTAVSDISVLSTWSNLRIVTGSNTAVTSIDPLAENENLTEIYFSNCGLFDVNATFKSLRLRVINLSGNELDNIDAFSDCTVLESVDISYNKISDISILSKSSATLKKLNLSANILEYSDLEFISDCALLTEIYLDFIPLENLDMLINAEYLTKITAVSCGISDISGLSGCKKLTYVRLPTNKISDISPLGQMNVTGNVDMDLAFNPISDISVLPNVKFKTLVINNDSIDYGKLNFVNGSAIVISYNETFDALEKSNLNVYSIVMIDCPADKQVQVDDSIVGKTITFISSDEFITKMSEFGFDYSYLN